MILAIYGAGGLGREVFVIAKKIGAVERRWDEIVFIDDVNDIREVEGRRVFKFAELEREFPAGELEVAIAIGEPEHRREMLDRVMARGLRAATLIHPGVYIDETTTVGAGAVICEGVTITCGVSIGDGALIHPHAVIGHDITIGRCSVIGSNCQIGGKNTIGERVYMGFLSGTKEHLTIGSDVICAAGAIVFRDLPDGVVAVGNPARIMKRNEDKRIF